MTCGLVQKLQEAQIKWGNVSMFFLLVQSVESQGDYDFVLYMFKEYNQLMKREINKITRNKWDTDDVIQSVYIALIGKLPLLRTLSKPKLINYVIVASRNTALNYMRSLNKVEVISYDDDKADASQFISESSVEKEIFLRESQEDLIAAWKKLDERSRQLIESKYVLEKSDKEIAAELGVGENSVRMALSRARKLFRALLE